MHLGLSYKDYVIKKVSNMENIKDYQQYLRGYDYTGISISSLKLIKSTDKVLIFARFFVILHRL